MINTYHYGGQHPISHQLALQSHGPLIQTIIAHPKKVAEKIEQRGNKTPTATVMALIDTGASISIITDKIAQDLKLIQTGYIRISSVQDQQDRPEYFVTIGFPWGRGKEVSVASCPLQGINCLIGRDILMHWNITYNGHDGFIIICD